MCLMIQSKTSEKLQKVSLLFRVNEIILLFVWTNNHLKFTVSIMFQILIFIVFELFNFYFFYIWWREMPAIPVTNHVSGSRGLDTKK